MTRPRPARGRRPTWSPKGGLILYQRSATGNEIRLVSVTNGAQSLVTKDGAVDPEDTVSDPDFALDGLHVMFLAMCEAPGICDGNFNTPNIMSSNLDGSDRIDVSDSCGCEGDPDTPSSPPRRTVSTMSPFSSRAESRPGVGSAGSTQDRSGTPSIQIGSHSNPRRLHAPILTDTRRRTLSAPSRAQRVRVKTAHPRT